MKSSIFDYHFKTFDFINKDEILKTLSTIEGRLAYKYNKSDIFKYLPPVKNRNYVYRKFEDLDIACIVVTDDLFIIDCDNLHTFDLLISLLPETLSTKSPYGGHIYFIRQNNEYLKDCLPFNKIDLKNLYKNPLDYYTKSKVIDFQIFTSDTRTNIPVFDGNNGYYKIHTLSPIKILDEDIMSILYDLSHSEPSLDLPSIKLGSNYKPTTFNKSRANRIKSWIKYSNLDNFVEYYQSYDPLFSSDNITNRNETLLRISMWAGRTGYLTEKEWRDFVLLVYDKIFAPLSTTSSPFTIEEVNKTILAPNKFSKYFNTPEETEEEIRLIKATERQVTGVSTDKAISFLSSGVTEFITRNPNPSGGRKYFYVQLTKGTYRNVMYLYEKSLTTFLLTRPHLIDYYTETVTDKKGNPRVLIKEDNMFLANFTNKVLSINNNSLYKIDSNNILTVNFGYFYSNPKVPRILDKLKTGDYNVDDIIYRFKHTYYYYVTEGNFFYDDDPSIAEQRRAKFEGDLGYHLRTGDTLPCMSIFRDNGGTGKDKLLCNFINLLFLGLPDKGSDDIAKPENYAKDILLEVKDNNKIAPVTPDKLSSSQFNGFLNNRAVIFTEVPKGVESNPSIIRQFIKDLTPLVSNDYAEINEKFEKIKIVRNNKFYTWFTNYTKEIIFDKHQNRRFYLYNGVRNVDITDSDVRLSIYKSLNYDMSRLDLSSDYNEVWSVFKYDEDTLLEYILLVAPDLESYKLAGGHSKLPSWAMSGDMFDDEQSEFEDLHKDSDITSIEAGITIFNTFITPEGYVRKSNLDKYLSDVGSDLYEVSEIIASTLYRQYQYEEYDRFKSVDTCYRIVDLVRAILEVPLMSNFRSGLANTKRYLNSESKKILTRDNTRSTASRLHFKGLK